MWTRSKTVRMRCCIIRFDCICNDDVIRAPKHTCSGYAVNGNRLQWDCMSHSDVIGHNDCLFFFFFFATCRGSLVAMALRWQAWGRRFDPGRYGYISIYKNARVLRCMFNNPRLSKLIQSPPTMACIIIRPWSWHVKPQNWFFLFTFQFMLSALPGGLSTVLAPWELQIAHLQSCWVSGLEERQVSFSEGAGSR